MRCCHCGEKEATKTYERKGKVRKIEYYCMDCYDRLFLNAEHTERENSLTTCPYCGMNLEEVQSTKLVGCAYCYRSMKGGVYPIVVKMQGDGAHKGKAPSVGEDKNGDFRDLAPEVFEAALRKERYKRQCNELEIIIAKLKSENNYEDAKDYADKLSLMLSNKEIEEEFVWRTRCPLSKQP